ncbi:hypothetical protein NECID01_1977 [Nematocida sp. AWRm77]|nr:hypothetical protein NECID01_1977 [Nematocida sp. AWRm77]
MEHAERILQSKDNYFQVLQVTKDTPTEEVKAKFRTLAKLVHPDRNKTPKATEAFVVLRKAYDELSDEKRRREYTPGDPERFQRRFTAPPRRHPHAHAGMHTSEEFEELIRAMMRQRPFGYGGTHFEFGFGPGMGVFSSGAGLDDLYGRRREEVSLSNYTVIIFLVLLVVSVLIK